MGTLAAGASRSFPIVVRPTAAVAGKPITNIATAAGDQPDPTPANDAAQATITVQPLDDLSVDASVSPDPLIPGREATYTATIDNHGPDTAVGVELTDALPPGLTGVSATASQGRCTITASGEISCKLGDLRSGGAIQVTIVARVAKSLAGKTLSDSLKLTQAEADSNTRNNSTTLTTRVAPLPTTAGPPSPVVDLSIGIRVRERHVRTDGLLHFTITAANLSDTPATGVRVTGSLNAPVRLVSVSAGAARISTSNSGPDAAGVCAHVLPLVCTLGRLNPHEDVTIRLVVRPLAALRLLGTVSIRADQRETTLVNNHAQVEILVAAARASVVVHKSALEHQVKGGSTVHYGIDVRPVGDAAALAVRVCDRLPSDQAYAAVDGAAYVNGEACWTISRLDPGTTRHYSISAIVDRSPTTHSSTNTVLVVGSNIAPRSAHASIRVLAVPGRPGGAGG